MLRRVHRSDPGVAVKVLVITGVSGSGKTTIGLALARRLRFEFIEGDEFHSRANREKMHAGIALTDDDRQPWLLALRSRIDVLLARNGNAVLTCSALRQSCRDVLAAKGVKFVYLKISERIARERLARRRGHAFNPALLESQFETLEEPHDALVVDAEKPDLDVASQIVRDLARSHAATRTPRRAASKA